MIQYRPADQLINHIIDALEQWVSRRPTLANADAELILSPISVVPIFVSKWIDYSNKYGFGYQLSDKTVGVLFNEGTRICQSAPNDNNQCYEFTDLRNKSVAWNVNSPPPSFVDLSSRLKLLDYFTRYALKTSLNRLILSVCIIVKNVSNILFLESKTSSRNTLCTQSLLRGIVNHYQDYLERQSCGRG